MSFVNMTFISIMLVIHRMFLFPPDTSSALDFV